MKPARHVDYPDPRTNQSGGSTQPLLPADACSYIVLFATGHIADIVADLPYQFAVAGIAKDEARSIRRGGEGDDAQQLVPVDWSDLIASGHIAVLSLSGDAEATTYIALLDRLDDGEAATLAIAIHRSLAVATDDRIARREFASRAPHLPLFSTLELLHQWCRRRCLSSPEIGELLRNVRQRGRFLPPRGDPLAAWWHQHYPRS